MEVTISLKEVFKSCFAFVVVTALILSTIINCCVFWVWVYTGDVENVFKNNKKQERVEENDPPKLIYATFSAEQGEDCEQ